MGDLFLALRNAVYLNVRVKKILLILVLISSPGFTAETHLSGEITNITSYAGGLLVRMNGTEKPTACSQSSAWMLIPEENQTMISVALAMYMSGNKNATVYIDLNSTGSYCKIVQYDPA